MLVKSLMLENGNIAKFSKTSERATNTVETVCRLGRTINRTRWHKCGRRRLISTFWCHFRFLLFIIVVVLISARILERLNGLSCGRAWLERWNRIVDRFRLTECAETLGIFARFIVEKASTAGQTTVAEIAAKKWTELTVFSLEYATTLCDINECNRCCAREKGKVIRL